VRGARTDKEGKRVRMGEEGKDERSRERFGETAKDDRKEKRKERVVPWVLQRRKWSAKAADWSGYGERLNRRVRNRNMFSLINRPWRGMQIVLVVRHLKSGGAMTMAM
jgi:hypothetical protein